ncbi:Archaeo-eukaryotic release factor domain-containing protein [Phanerochaete sordida]|uniref:Archaeo-eukaryotic release factor domain-containing protein n=1 Tax=Phanerochaete sordida TaxID=48140 RepID=A0A9P3LDD9_9APHY|nr:Archaeo-eukaryotic release factor domain-containing protein [Phanerochaete sordida]
MARYEQYHVFSIPQPLLDTLVPRSIGNLPAAAPPVLEEPSRPSSPSPAPLAPAGARACNICLGATFADVDEQRTHFRSDWHRYNVKMRVSGGNAVSEVQFAQLADGLEDSLSGSASSSDDNDESDDDAVSTLVRKTKRLHTIREDGDGDDETSTRSVPNAPLAWFHSPPATQLGIYKVLFPSDLISYRGEDAGQRYLQELKDMQSGGGEEGRKWALFMTAGGHFAGAVIRVSRPEGEEDSGTTKKGKQKKPKPDTEVLLHKTFHRYTTRRKQGGSQGLNDSSGRKAISAGAQLRRYGEQALRDDIRNLLTDWADELHDCERIFIRASVSNRRIFLDYEGAILEKGDDRLRTFPFPTRRPTQSELLRCLQELTRVKISHLTEDALREQDDAYLASLPKPKPAPAPAPAQPPRRPEKPKLTAEEAAQLDAQRALAERWARALEMVAKGRLDALRAFLARGDPLGPGGVDARAPEGVEDAAPGETLLVYAVRRGAEDAVRWLLEDARADPTLAVQRADAPAPAADDEGDEDGAPVPGTRRTAYDYARTRGVRNVFRRCAAEHAEWWDWLGAGEGGARVPSALSRAMEEEREGKKKVRRRGLKDKIREREAAQKEREAELPAAEPPKPEVRRREPAEGPRKLGGAAGAGESVMGLTPEMRAKVERERRARAAEARMKALGGGR